MPNTDHLQLRPDALYEPEETSSGGRGASMASNPRYRTFRQAHFTAGDENQFLSFWDTRPSTGSETRHEGKSRTAADVYSTFAYLFHEMKKGIFVRIRGGEMTNFLPFSKIDYENTFARHWRWNQDRFPMMNDLFRWIAERGGYTFNRDRVHQEVGEWYANNGLVRYEHPISEGDSGVNMIRDMMMALVRERDLPDADFFINKRDFPVVSRDPSRHPYEAMYGVGPAPDAHRTRHRPAVDIMSMTTSPDHLDICVPTWEDWCRASYQKDGRVFLKPKRAYPDCPRPDPALWATKQPTAVFRGASTGLSLDEANPRIRVARLSLSDTNKKEQLLDAGITKWNLRPRRASADMPFDTFSEATVSSIPLVPYMSLLEQASRYRYILHLPGHSCAYRLAYELSSGSVVILYPCRYRLWYMDRLIPLVHYVPLGEDEDVLEKIRWCRNNDELMRTIAQNARDFYDRHLTYDGILDFWRDLLWDRHRCAGPVVYPGDRSLYRAQIDLQRGSVHPPISGPSEEGVDAYASWAGTMRSASHEQMSRLWDTAASEFSDAWWIQEIIQKNPLLYHNRATEIRQIEIGSYSFCLKIRSFDDAHGQQRDREAFLEEIRHDGFMTLRALRPWEGLGYFPQTFTIRTLNDPSDRCLKSVMVSEMIVGRTMEQWLQSPWTSTEAVLTALLDVLGQVSLMLDWMQDMAGLLHMDLYPWNVMIRPITHDRVRRHFPVWLPHAGTGGYQMTLLEQPRPSWTVFLVDFGRSHIFHEGFPHQNTCPFVRSRMHDVVTLVWNAVYLLFRSHRLSPAEIHTVRRLLSFFDPILPPPFREGRWRIAPLMRYLQNHKRFSRLLHDTYENPMPPSLTPLAFAHHLQRMSVQRPRSESIFRTVRTSHWVERTFPNAPPPPCASVRPRGGEMPVDYRVWPVDEVALENGHAVSKWLDGLQEEFRENRLEGTVVPVKPSSLTLV